MDEFEESAEQRRRNDRENREAELLADDPSNRTAVAASRQLAVITPESPQDKAWLDKVEEDLRNLLKRLRDGHSVDDDSFVMNRFERRYDKNPINFALHWIHLVLITRRPHLRRLLLEQLQESGSRIHKILFYIDRVYGRHGEIGHPLRRSPPNFAFPTEQEMHASTAVLGQFLNSVQSLEKIMFHGLCTGVPIKDCVYLSMVQNCPNIRKLGLYLPMNSRSFPNEIRALLPAIQNHLLLEHLEVSSPIGKWQLMLPSWHLWMNPPNLSLSLGTPLGWHLTEDAVRPALAIDQVQSFTLGDLQLRTAYGAANFCRALTMSNILHLSVLSWQIPEEYADMVAEAISGSKIIDLVLQGMERTQRAPGFLEAMSFALTTPDNSVRSLTLDSGMLTDINFNGLLRYAPSWKLEKLRIWVNAAAWSNDLEHGLAQYLAVNEHLRSLGVWISRQEGDDEEYSIAPDVLLEAVRTGNGCLDSIHFAYRHDGADDEPDMFDAAWVENMNTAVVTHMNRLKRVHGPLFQEAFVANPGAIGSFVMAKALASTDHVAKFAFLRNNECGSLEKLLENLP